MPKKEESPYQLANKENTQFKKKVGFLDENMDCCTVGFTVETL